MSRRTGDAIRCKSSSKACISNSPRTSVYDRLGPPGIVSQPMKNEETCRYILKNGHCRFGNECTYDHGPSISVLHAIPSGEVTQVITPSVDVDSLFIESNTSEGVFQDGRISSNSTIGKKLSEMDQIKDNIRRHISGSSKAINFDDKDSPTSKSTRGLKHMGSVVQRGCKSIQAPQMEDHSDSKDKCLLKSQIPTSTLQIPSLDLENSLTSESFGSGDDKDSSTDSISGNEALVSEIASSKDFKDKALSSISESSFSSVPSSSKITTGRKKREIHSTTRVSKDPRDRLLDSVAKKNIHSNIHKYDNSCLKISPKRSDILSSRPFRSCSHRYPKKHYKRIKSISDEVNKCKKDHHRDKKRLSRSNQGTQDDLTKDNFRRNDKEKKYRNPKRSKVGTSSVEEPITIKKSSLNKSSEFDKCVLFNEPDTTDQQLIAHPELVITDNIASYTPTIEANNYLINDSSSTTLLNSSPFPNCSISHNMEGISEAKIPLNRRIESNTHSSMSNNRNALNLGHKRKPNRKIADSLEKKVKKSESLSISRTNTISKNCKIFGKSTMHIIYTKPISDSPMKIIRDNLEIYDSLSDIDQGNVLEEDFSFQKSHQFINCSNLLNIDWSGIKYNVTFNGRASSNSPSCLLSQVGLSYSLLGSEIYTQCLNKIFEDQPNSKGYSYGLSIGAIIEEIIFLERERLRIQFEQLSNFGFVKNKDIYLRGVLSGYSGDTNSHSVPISANIHVSPGMSTDIFHSALNIYHHPSCPQNTY